MSYPFHESHFAYHLQPLALQNLYYQQEQLVQCLALQHVGSLHLVQRGIYSLELLAVYLQLFLLAGIWLAYYQGFLRYGAQDCSSDGEVVLR